MPTSTLNKAGISCPRCDGSMLRERTGELTCFSCGYEYIASVPITMQVTKDWKRKITLPYELELGKYEE